MSARTTPAEVFLSYAQADELLCLELEKHLGVLKREGLLTTWHKGQIGVGRDRDEQVHEHLSTASIILLLLSADFVASDYCYSVEMNRAMGRHKAGEVSVIPVVLRPMDDWSNMPFGRLQALPADGVPVTGWPDAHAALADVARGIRSVLQEGKLPPSVTPPPALPTVWNIPYLRNVFFTGREQLLQQLADALKAGRAVALSQPQVISGLGGIGKTQIAVEYAYRHLQNYQTVLWTLADTRESLVSGYIAIAGLLRLPERNERDQTVIVQAVKTWLQTHSSWLLILDNADDLKLTYDFLPLMGGHLLITTRAQVTGTQAQRIEVDIMPHEVGALFLLHRSKLVTQDVLLADIDEASRILAHEICEELGGLPLALDQAGAYIEEMHCSLQDYQQRYRTRRTFLLQRRGGLIMDHPEPVATTWSLSFEKVEQRSPIAADLLRLCAFLHPDAIPVELVTKGVEFLGSTLTSVAEDEIALDEAIGTLRVYSLIRRNEETKTLSLHRLVQAVLKDVMDEQARQQWVERAVLAVSETFPVVSFTVWPQCERCLPHALVCAELVKQGRRIMPQAAKLFYHAGAYLIERVRYHEAEPLLQQALQICEQHFGEAHPDTADVLDRLARLFEVQGKYSEAEPLYKRALMVKDQELGAMHPDTATSLNNLALLYREQGKYAEAEPLFLRAISIDEKVYGHSHPEVAIDLHNLAILYGYLGKYAEEEQVLLRVLSIDESELGATHPSTATVLNDLAVLYDHQGKYSEAELLYKRALLIREQQLGAMHPDTAVSLGTLARIYIQQKKYAEAESHLQRALSVFEQQLGPLHPHVATCLIDLAKLYEAQGKFAETEPVYKRALLIREQALGQDHPRTQTVRANYARLLDAIKGEISEGP